MDDLTSIAVAARDGHGTTQKVGFSKAVKTVILQVKGSE